MWRIRMAAIPGCSSRTSWSRTSRFRWGSRATIRAWRRECTPPRQTSGSMATLIPRPRRQSCSRWPRRPMSARTGFSPLQTCSGETRSRGHCPHRRRAGRAALCTRSWTPSPPSHAAPSTNHSSSARHRRRFHRHRPRAHRRVRLSLQPPLRRQSSRRCHHRHRTRHPIRHRHHRAASISSPSRRFGFRRPSTASSSERWRYSTRAARCCKSTPSPPRPATAQGIKDRRSSFNTNSTRPMTMPRGPCCEITGPSGSTRPSLRIARR